MSPPTPMVETGHHPNATMAGPLAAEALNTGGKGTIHAVFPSVFYADLPGGLIAITTPQIPPGPVNLATDWAIHDWQKTGLKVGTSAHVFKGFLKIGGLPPIDLHKAKTWHPPQINRPNHKTLQTALTRLAARMPAPPSEGYGTALLSPPPEIIAAQSGLARAVNRDLANPTWAHALLGRGPGLTPSGDDLLGGAMIALHTLGKGDTAQTLWKTLSPLAAQNTNRISRTLLAAAAQGVGNAPLHAALNALILQENLTPALAQLDHIGHSSGWDAFAGAVLTFRAAIAPAKAAA